MKKEIDFNIFYSGYKTGAKDAVVLFKRAIRYAFVTLSKDDPVTYGDISAIADAYIKGAGEGAITAVGMLLEMMKVSEKDAKPVMNMFLQAIKKDEHEKRERMAKVLTNHFKLYMGDFSAKH